MELYIDLNRQLDKKKHRVWYKALAVLSLLLSIGYMIVAFIEGMSIVQWLTATYYSGITVLLFYISFGKSPTDLIGKSYFKINDIGIIYKSSIFRNKIAQYNWSEVEEIKIRLFELELKIGNRWVSINLEGLTDDNLKSAKEVLLKIQSEIDEKKSHKEFTSLDQILQSSI